MRPPDLQRVGHIQEYCGRIQRSVLRYGRSFETFRSDEDFQQSVAFSVLQIGELCNGLSEEYRKATGAEIQWNAIRGLRNIVAHAYGTIKLRILWDVVLKDIPELEQFCREQLSVEEEPEEP